MAADDFVTPYLDVYPYDDTTEVTLEVRPPSPTAPYDAGTCTPTLVTVDIDGTPTVVQRWTAPPVAASTPHGWWVLAWTITGTGTDAPEQEFFVAPPPASGGATWTPTLAGVADYVPHRTVPAGFESQGLPVNTFTDTTTPPASAVQRIIRRAVSWVLSSTGALVTTGELDEAAQECAALRAAGFVELAATPNADRELAAELFKQAEAALKTLTARNRALTGADGDDPTPAVAVMPVYSFPSPSPYGDYTL